MNIDSIIKAAPETKEKQKQEKVESKIKLAYFNLVHLLIKEKRETFPITITLIIVQFLQMISFSFSPTFTKYWTSNKYSTLGSFIYYFQLVSILEGRETLYLFLFFCSCLYVLLIFLLIVILSFRVNKLKLPSKRPLYILNFFFDLNDAIFLPIIKLFISIFNCNKEEHFYTTTLKCFNTKHWVIACIGGFFLILYLIMAIIFQITNFEYRKMPHILSSKLSSNTSLELLLTKVIIVLLFEIFPSQTTLNICCSFLLSLGIFYRFLLFFPFYNKIINKIYFTMYALFLWTNAIVIISIIGKSLFKEKNYPLLLIGYFLIIANSILGFNEFTLDNFIQNDDLVKDPLRILKKIKYFVTLVDDFHCYSYRKENVFLFGYLRMLEKFIDTQETQLQIMLEDCKHGGVTSLERKTLQNLLYHHGVLMYKNALKRFPDDIMLRISFSNFLYEKLHQRHRCLEELSILDNFDLNFEESFLLFRYRKIISEQIDGEQPSGGEENSDFVSSLAFKKNKNAFKSSIFKISKCYVDFWSLLYETDLQNHSENFEKMSNLGREIGRLNERIHFYFQKIEQVTTNDFESTQLYTEFLEEILHDSESAERYQKKLHELEKFQQKFDENNIYRLNFKVLSQNEDYKYIVADSQPDSFGKIMNLSLSVCSTFGYKKEELIGKSINIIIPDIYVKLHNKLITKKLTEFIKNPNAQKTRRTKFKEYKVFGKNKARYLIPCLLKSGIILNEEGQMFFVSQFLKGLNQVMENQESCHVMTDNKLVIQHFTCNSIHYLGLDSSSISSNVEILNFIEEFNEEMFNLEMKYSGKLRSCSEKIKQKVLEEHYFKPREITWAVPGYIMNGMKSALGFRGSMILPDGTHQSPGRNEKIDSSREESSKKLKLSIFPSSQGIELSPKRKPRNSKLIVKKEKNFYIEVKSLIIDERRVGYLFQFTPSLIYLRHHRSHLFETLLQDINSPEEKKRKPRPSLIFGSIFQQIILNKKDPYERFRKKKKEEVKYLPQIDSHSDVFSFNIDNLSFKQGDIKETEMFREKLKEMATQKVFPPVSETEESEETSEEYDSNSYSSESGMSNSNCHSSIFDSGVGFNKQTLRGTGIQSNGSKKRQNNSKNENDEFYHVNFNYISLYLYNFQRGGFDKQTDFKGSKVDAVMNKWKELPKKKEEKKEQEKEGTLEEEQTADANDEFVNGKKKSEKKKEIILIQPVQITTKDIIMNQMKMELNNKEISPIILYLSLVTFFMFLSLNVICFLIIWLDGKSKKSILQHFNLMFHTFELNQNFLFSVHTIREITLLKLPGYTNVYFKNRTKYVEGLKNQTITYFHRNVILLEEFSAILGTLDEEDKESLKNSFINLTMIDDDGEIGYYPLPMLSAFLENNMALYNIWKKPFDEQTLENPDLFFFLHNALDGILSGGKVQTQLLFEKFKSMIVKEKNKFLLFIGLDCLFFFLTYFLFVHCYDKVEELKQNYLAVFYEIGENLITSCLNKCELFYHKVQAQASEENIGSVLISNNSDEISDVIQMKKGNVQSRKRTNNAGKLKIIKASPLIKISIFGLFLFFCLFSCSIALSKIIFLEKYNNISKYVNHHGSYQLLYLVLFLSVREELCQPSLSFMGAPVSIYASTLMKTFYIRLKTEYNLALKYRPYMPSKYRWMNRLVIYDNICPYPYINEFFESIEQNCEDFMYSTMKYGMKYIYSSYTENVRAMHEKYTELAKLLKNNGILIFEKPLEYYDKYYSNSDKKLIWEQYSPVTILNSDLHKNLVVLFDFVIKEIYTQTSSKMSEYVFAFQSRNHDIILYLLYSFISIELIAFFAFITPFEVKLNQTIFKAKNMLSIIPLEVLSTLNQVKKMLEINEKSKSRQLKGFKD